jgi:hypothetical protein
MLGRVTAPRAEIARNVEEIRERISSAAARGGRDPRDVRIVAAAKTVDPERIRWVAAAGVTAIGHNYVQELAAARTAVGDLPVRWHYIGNVRSGTATRVADLADVVETLAGERAARRLAGRAARSGRTLDALIEVDLTGTRGGGAAPPPPPPPPPHSTTPPRRPARPRPRHGRPHRLARWRPPPGADDGPGGRRDRGSRAALVRSAPDAAG